MRRLTELHSLITDLLTYKQFEAISMDREGISIWYKDPSYLGYFERVLKVSKRAKVRALAEEGIRICHTAEVSL